MNIIPRSHSVVPVCPYALAVSLAIADVEKRLQGRMQRGVHPYASAFLRHYCGTRTVKAEHLRRVVPQYSPRDRFAPAAVEYLTALDVLIASRGERCPPPLSQDTAYRLFPQVAARLYERLDKRIDCRINRQERQEQKAGQQKHKRYQQRLAQAALALQFHTPGTVAAWYAQQQDQDFRESDMRRLVQAWLPLFVSCRGILASVSPDDPLWRVMLEIGAASQAASPEVNRADRLALPDQLPFMP